MDLTQDLDVFWIYRRNLFSSNLIEQQQATFVEEEGC